MWPKKEKKTQQTPHGPQSPMRSLLPYPHHLTPQPPCQQAHSQVRVFASAWNLLTTLPALSFPSFRPGPQCHLFQEALHDCSLWKDPPSGPVSHFICTVQLSPFLQTSSPTRAWMPPRSPAASPGLDSRHLSCELINLTLCEENRDS